MSQPQPSFSAAEMQELIALRAENAALKAKTAKSEAKRIANLKGTQLGDGVSCMVSVKGAVSVYGLARFPITLYKSQWMRLLPVAAGLIKFIQDNDSKLKVKELKAVPTDGTVQTTLKV